MPDEFDYVPRVRAAAAAPSWFSTFSATLAAVVLGGIILAAGGRAYLRWTVQQWGEEIRQKMDQARDEIRAKK